MTKIKVSLSMAYSPKQAAGLVTAQVDQILINLAKICSHKPSTTDKEWSDEIKNKQMYEIRRKALRTSDKKGHLSKDVLSALWRDGFRQQDLPGAIKSVFSDTAYKKKPKAGDVKAVISLLDSIGEPLRFLERQFASAVLADSHEDGDKFVETLTNLVETERFSIL